MFPFPGSKLKPPDPWRQVGRTLNLWKIGNPTVKSFSIDMENGNIGLGPFGTSPNIGIFQTETIKGSTDAAAYQISPTFSITLSSATTWNSLYGIAAVPAIGANNTGFALTVSNFISNRIEPLGKSGTGTINVTNAYGLYVDAQTVGGTLNRSIYTAANGVSEFDGQLIAHGTSAADSAGTGDIGEILETSVSSGASVTLTTATAANIATVTLTAGDWDVWANIVVAPGTASVISQTFGWISSQSATFPVTPNAGAYAGYQITLTAGNGISLPVGMRRVSVSSTTDIYLSTFVSFSSGCTAHGYIGARRRR